ncbi:MAG: hypothetical protein JWQ35_925 [Bacteriovoracaceae bacterium]|nr:hypothetical protein [Bacteriovoracaceae bacterium]
MRVFWIIAFLSLANIRCFASAATEAPTVATPACLHFAQVLADLPKDELPDLWDLLSMPDSVFKDLSENYQAFYGRLPKRLLSLPTNNNIKGHEAFFKLVRTFSEKSGSITTRHDIRDALIVSEALQANELTGAVEVIDTFPSASPDFPRLSRIRAQTIEVNRKPIWRSFTIISPLRSNGHFSPADRSAFARVIKSEFEKGQSFIIDTTFISEGEFDALMNFDTPNKDFRKKILSNSIIIDMNREIPWPQNRQETSIILH